MKRIRDKVYSSTIDWGEHVIDCKYSKGTVCLFVRRFQPEYVVNALRTKDALYTQGLGSLNMPQASAPNAVDYRGRRGLKADHKSIAIGPRHSDPNKKH